LYASLHRCGYANQPTSVHRDDGLRLQGAWVSAAVRCAPPANKPSPTERDTCRPYLERELALLRDVRVGVVLGQFAWDVVTSIFRLRPRPRFGHGAEVTLATGQTLIGSYHVSQQNTFTGVLTEAMIDAVFTRARELAAATSGRSPVDSKVTESMAPLTHRRTAPARTGDRPGDARSGYADTGDAGTEQ
ncbi:MAG: hypothetical protein LC808_33430, partial [Actinobacteria bacterium]|nr:hypothetical protein [Actinomycetota bacterium]